MRELLRRLRLAPLATARLVFATTLVNLLAFASPLFVMLILGQYVESGFDGTLYTLAAGMGIALLLQAAFQQLRTPLAEQLCTGPDRALGEAVLTTALRARGQALTHVPEARRRELAGQVHLVQEAYAPATICAVLDAPFALLSAVAVFAFSLPLGLLGLLFAAVTVGAGLLGQGALRDLGRATDHAEADCRALALQSVDGADTVRMLRAAGHLGGLWRGAGETLLLRRMALAARRVRGLTTQGLLATLARVLVFAVGAYECVHGRLDVARLIVCSILVSHVLRQAAALVAAGDRLVRATQALGEMREFLRLPLEPDRGTALKRFSGRLELRDLAFAHPGSSGPLFESLSLRLEPGRLAVIHGDNGTGKTTLARLLAGLLEPLRGAVLADGITLRQLAPPWWRGQLAYLPQEPEFLGGSVRENVLPAAEGPGGAPGPDFDELVRRADLERALRGLPGGADAPLDAVAFTLPQGVRRRLALARALGTGGRLAIFDEPFEGLDDDGARAVRSALDALRAGGATVVVLTHDPAPFAHADVFVDLNAKPVPAIRAGAPAPPPAAPGAEDRHGRP